MRHCAPTQEYFSANPGADKIRKLQAKVDLTVDIMSGNLGAWLALALA